MKKYLAEMIGTMVLVLMGCGSAVFLGHPNAGVVGIIGVSMAFGLSVVAMAYAIGGISNCHLNPAITLGCLLTGRMKGGDAAMHMLFQVIGAILGSAILYALVQGFPTQGTLTGANGWGGGVTTTTAFIAETVFTMIFVLVVLGATDKRTTAGFAGLAIGLSLILIHLVCIPITGTSVNPARSIGPAIFEGGQALCQLWLFIVAPLLGAAIAAGVWKIIDPAPAKK